jgi:IS1 family transposase
LLFCNFLIHSLYENYFGLPVYVWLLLYTDQYGAYSKLNKDYTHHIVNHSRGEYVVGRAHTNTIEGFWSLLKRGIIGIYHSDSVKHLDTYIDEFEFRYNTREIPFAESFCLMLSKTNGRLDYDTLNRQMDAKSSILMILIYTIIVMSGGVLVGVLIECQRGN